MKRARGAHAADLLARPARAARALAGWIPGTKALAGLAWRERGPRARIALLAGLAVAVLLGAGAGAALGGAGHPSHTTEAPGTAAVPGSATRAARWLAGPAGQLLSAVSGDLGRLTVAERSRQLGPARLAGLRLTADARAALAGLAPPGGARLYRAALTELVQAGRRAAAGSVPRTPACGPARARSPRRPRWQIPLPRRDSPAARYGSQPDSKPFPAA